MAKVPMSPKMFEKKDRQTDAKHGMKEGSARDKKADAKAGKPAPAGRKY